MRPAMEYRELNEHVDADICSAKLREWRQQGVNVAILDLRNAYLQVHVYESLWPYQVVMIQRKRFCLKQLGFFLYPCSLLRSRLGEDVGVIEVRLKGFTASSYLFWGPQSVQGGKHRVGPLQNTQPMYNNYWKATNY